MELTPINVPGKRRRSNKAAADAPRKKKKKTKSKSSRRKAREEKLPPRLEYMPLEILENIFFLSRNANLPLSSLAIGRRLSNELTRRDFFILAFESTWNRSLGVDVDGFGNTLPKDDPKLQSELLKQPFANITFILTCWDRFVMKFAESQIAQGKPFDKKHITLWGDPHNERNVKLDPEDGMLINPKKASDCFWHDYAAFRRIDLLNHENLEWFARERLEGNPAYEFQPLLQVHPKTRIPDSLLDPSTWNQEAFQKLFWLVRAGAELSPDQTWEVTLPAFRHIAPMRQSRTSLVRTPRPDKVNLAAVRLFDYLEVYDNWPMGTVQEEARIWDREGRLVDYAASEYRRRVRFGASRYRVPEVTDLKSFYVAQRLAESFARFLYRRWG
ncbi:hypothetical protein K449DRAFT_389084 [Hypoxylon sp. EC38]|nr:hypothetical protein K449DRAFT_389084 [Hypoxylon sp. EC38]